MPVFGARLKKIQQQLSPHGVMVIPAAPAVVRNRDTHYPYRAHSDILYLTGVNEEELALVITPAKVHVFAQTRNPERERWVGKVKGHDFFFRQLEGPELMLYEPADFRKVCGESLKGAGTLYYDFGLYAELDRHLLSTLHEMANLSRRGTTSPRSIVRASEILHELRLFKDEHDLKAMRRAAEISAAAHNQVQEFITAATGVLSEFEIKALIEREFMHAGADRLAYPSIVAAGENATILHYEGSAATAKPGEFVLIDAGCEFDGYASDITRTTVCGGWQNAGALKKDLYDIVLAAQHEAIRLVKPGVTIDEIHAAAIRVLSEGLYRTGLFRQVPRRKKGENPLTGEWIALDSVAQAIEEEYYNLFYMHRTSHYLGLDVHDVGDYYCEGKSRALEAGMVITIEPGLYFPAEYEFLAAEVRGIGIRIEDDVLVTPTGNDVLTSACRS